MTDVEEQSGRPEPSESPESPESPGSASEPVVLDSEDIQRLIGQLALENALLRKTIDNMRSRLAHGIRS